MKHIILALCTVSIAGLILSVACANPGRNESLDGLYDSVDVHKEMAKWDGEWNEEIHMWMAPGAPPQKMQATCVNKMILGGRYQESKHTGNFMGMPFEGISTTGYDNAEKFL